MKGKWERRGVHIKEGEERWRVKEGIQRKD